MNCNKCKKKTKCLTWRYVDVEGCKYFKPKTHFDRIKAMSVEEMADFIFVNFQTDEFLNPIVDSKVMYHENDIIEWLESEVQEDE